MWDLESMGVSRSRSVCGFRGGFDHSEGNITLSTGRPSVLKKDGHADSEKKKSGGKIDRLFQSEDVFGCVKRDGPSMVSENGSKSIRKGGLIEFDGSFSVDEDPGFIDLKLSLSSESKPEFSCLKNDNFLKSASSFITRDGNLSGDESQSFDYFREGMLGNGTSCRITVNNNEIKKCKKSFKVWKWIVKHHSSTAGRPSWQKDEHDSKI
ncbi:hypothetical protein IFM89_013864 [Coptis chinensis]|uniref:Uncharacterized protein n=1 Tax=Coptis chinensis TaxID=261450 RepID=A0A835IWV4_9MAGN|nr:hypothetical protein IFM89_013864 [Coptis chinensis]